MAVHDKLITSATLLTLLTTDAGIRVVSAEDRPDVHLFGSVSADQYSDSRRYVFVLLVGGVGPTTATVPLVEEIPDTTAIGSVVQSLSPFPSGHRSLAYKPNAN